MNERVSMIDGEDETGGWRDHKEVMHRAPFAQPSCFYRPSYSDITCANVVHMVYRRLGDKTFGRQTFGRQFFFSDDHLGDTGWTFRRQQLKVWATVVETFRRQKGSVTALTSIEQPQRWWSCKRLLSAISDVISSGCIG